MYNKRRINGLFAEYCKTEDAKVFEALLIECRPLVDVILSKYPFFRPWWDDISQEVLLKIWMNLRRPDQLRKHLRSPVSFLYSRIWPYIYYSLETIAKQYGVPLALNEKELLIINLHEERDYSYDRIAELTKLAPATVKCMYYIGRQKRDRILRMGLDMIEQPQQTVGDYLDPATRWEIQEERRQWCEKVVKRLSSHLYYKKNRKALLRVKILLRQVVEEEIIGDQG